MHHVFGASQYRIDVARTGEEGIRRVAERAPDVVLLDLRLPDLSGLDVYQRIRQIDARIPVVFITAATAAHHAIEAMKQGAFDYLIKPLDAQQLRRVVGQALELARLMPRAGRRRRDAAPRTNTATRSSAAAPPCRRSTRRSAGSPRRTSPS